MAKKPRPLTRQQKLEAVAAECAERGVFFPSIEIAAPTRPTNRYAAVMNVHTGEITRKFEFCDNRKQMTLIIVADKLLQECGFFDEQIELRAWLDEPENKAWFEAANPAAITPDGHLAASHAFY